MWREKQPPIRKFTVWIQWGPCQALHHNFTQKHNSFDKMSCFTQLVFFFLLFSQFFFTNLDIKRTYEKTAVQLANVNIMIAVRSNSHDFYCQFNCWINICCIIILFNLLHLVLYILSALLKVLLHVTLNFFWSQKIWAYSTLNVKDDLNYIQLMLTKCTFNPCP